MNRSLSHGASRRLLARICLVALLGTSLLALPAGPVAAEEQPTRRVLLLSSKPTDLFVERIKAEVASLGLSVVVRVPSGPLEEDARGQHVTVAIRVLPAHNGVEVWMADETSGRSLLRQLIVDERPEGPDHNLIALQTAELLRTSLLSKAPEPETPGPAANPPSPADATPAPIADSMATTALPKVEPGVAMGAQAGMGALLSPGGASPELQLWLSLHRFFGPRIGLALDLSLPVVRATIDGPEGTARIGCAMAGATLLVRINPVSSAWFLTSGLGAGVLRVGVDGEAKPTLTSFSTNLLTGTGYARSEGGYTLSEWLRLGGQVLGGAALDHVNLRFAGNDAGSWGRLFAVATLFAEAAW